MGVGDPDKVTGGTFKEYRVEKILFPIFPVIGSHFWP